MFKWLLRLARGVGKDARVTATVRTGIEHAIVAILAAVELFLVNDPEVSQFSWVPLALGACRILEGFFDHGDPAKPDV